MNRIIIVGGGVIGMLTARELALAGIQVALFDRAETGRESSWAGGGIVSPLFPWRYLDSVTRLASWSQDCYPALCDELRTSTEVDPEFTRCGLLLIAPDEAATATEWGTQHRRRLEIVDSTQFRQLEPRAASVPENALWMPTVGQVRNPRMVRALRLSLQQPGIEIHTGETVEKLLIENDRCRGVLTAEGRYEADSVVICAGAWSSDLLSNLGSPPEIHPIRGQMLLFRTPPGTISRMVLEGSRYVIPRRDGRVLFGSTIEDVGFDKSTTAAAREELHSIATARFPVLNDHPVEGHWAGLRPSSPAGVPYIGPHPEIARLFVNAGHFRNGIVLGPASARLAADLLLDRTPIVDPTPYGWTAARG